MKILKPFESFWKFKIFKNIRTSFFQSFCFQIREWSYSVENREEKTRRERPLENKYKALVEFEKEKTNKDVTILFDIPANTLSTWKKNKEKIFKAFKNQNAIQSKRLKENTY